MGAPAVLAILSHEGDALRLKEAGATTSDWRQLPAGGVLNQTPFVILVRKGNPKNLHSFADLARPGVGIIHPDPLTSGGAKWSILAEFVSALKDPASTDPEDQARGMAQLPHRLLRSRIKREDDVGRRGIESTADETADKGHNFNKIYHASGACLRNEPETDRPIDPLQNFAGDPEDHLSCQLSPDINTEVL